MRPSHQASKRLPARLQEIRPRWRSWNSERALLGEVEEHVVVEVAPAELAAERLRPGSARQALLDLAHRQAAEVDVGREPRGPVGSECVVIVRVAGHVPAEEARQPLARPRLAAARRLLELLLETERAERRESPLREPRRQWGKPARRADHLAAGCLEPATVERREHRVRPAGLGAQRGEVVHRRDARVLHRRDALGAQRERHGLDPAPRERPHVGAEVHLVCPDLAGEARQLVLGRAPADHEATAALGERSVEVGQAVEQELGAGPGGVAPGKEPVLEAEDRHHALVALERRPQRGVVVDPQVAGVPDEGGHLVGTGRAARRVSRSR